MTSKTLGQVAYEALVVGYGENVDAKEWPGLSQATHEAWQAAAEAVVDQYLGPWPRTERYTKEREVVEAAKAWKASGEIDYDSPRAYQAHIASEQKLIATIEALQGEE